MRIVTTNRLRGRFATALLIGALVVLGLPSPSSAASAAVAARDNRFEPQEVHIDPGDSVVWTNQGARTHHVKADDGSFQSPVLSPGDSYSHTFEKEGNYFYFCKFHGAKGQVGMWGLVVVGNPPPPEQDKEVKDLRPTLVVPDDFPTIQKAVNAAKRGTRIVIMPGVYHEAVVVQTPGLIIEGFDRFRTILHGRDEDGTGITVDGVNNVVVKNLTVRNYVGNGVFFNNATGYTINRVDSIKNRTYGLYAFDSYEGVIKNSFAWGSGDGGLYIGECLGCSAIIENVVAKYNYLGYSGTNATGVVIRDSVWKHNHAGIVPNTLPTEELGPNRGTFIYNNVVANNNYKTVPAYGFSDFPVGIPWGTGIWLPGTENNIIKNNIVKNHESYGILISQSVDESLPQNNEVWFNFIRNSDSDGDGYGYDLAWDGTGANNCFTGNNIEGATGPPNIQETYACANRPFAGTGYPPVQAHLAESATNNADREQKEPPEPNRPDCQRCPHRHP